MQEQQNSAAGGPVTIDDVRLALGETSPVDTNASKIRAVLGRGSFATIQKHLDALRAQRVAAAQPAAEQSVPKPPAEAVDMLWAAAWGAAQTKTLARLESLSAERDGLQATAAAQAADVSALTEQLDTVEAQANAQAVAQAAAQAAAQEQSAAAAALAIEQQAALTAVQAALTAAQAESAHAKALADRDMQIERQTLQSAIDRMSDQLGELKAQRIAAQGHMEEQAAALATAQADILRVKEAAAHAAELAARDAEAERKNLQSIIEQLEAKLAEKAGKNSK